MFRIGACGLNRHRRERCQMFRFNRGRVNQQIGKKEVDNTKIIDILRTHISHATKAPRHKEKFSVLMALWQL